MARCLAPLLLLLASCSSGSTGGATTSCEGYANQSPANDVTVRFTNATSSALYVGMQGGCGALAPFEIHDPSGNVLTWTLGSCDQTCETLRKGQFACSALCAIPPLVVIAPGGHHDFTWNGTVFEQVAMPAACYGTAGSARPTCSRQVIAEAARYEFIGTSWLSADCGSAACLCTPSSDGSCTINSGGSVVGAGMIANATLDFPAANLTELTFR